MKHSSLLIIKDALQHRLMNSTSESKDAEIVLVLAEVEKEIYKASYTRGEFVKLHINCPECGFSHVDHDEWAKRLHRKHLCEKCGHTWELQISEYTFGI